MHLSETYGDRAFSVVRGASITGKRWPIVGKRLHDEYPYIEAEVSSDQAGYWLKEIVVELRHFTDVLAYNDTGYSDTVQSHLV